MKKTKLAVDVVIWLAVFALCIVVVLLTKGPETGTLINRIVNGFPVYFIGAFAAVGLSTLVNAIITITYRKNRCSYVTEAVCVDHKRTSNNTSDTFDWVYTPIYEFEYEGRTLNISNNDYAGRMFVTPVGSTDVIHVDIENMSDYYVGAPTRGQKNKLIVGLAFSIPSMAIIIYGLLAGLSII